MKERELEDLFRDAASAVPPASFDEQDIARGSRRVTARRRMTAAGGSLVAVVVLAGGLGTTLLGNGSGPGSVQAPQAGTRQAPSDSAAPSARDGGGQGPTVFGLPDTDGTGQGCGPPDRRLADALARELPELSEVTTPVAAQDCPASSRTASYQLGEGDVTAILSPVEAVPAYLRRPGATERPDGTKQITRRTDSGRVLILRSDPEPGSTSGPYEARLAAIAEDLAGRF